MTKRGGLGRGLSALIPGAVEEGTAAVSSRSRSNAVEPNPRQPRTMFDDETLDALALSIQEVGILQPIVVRKTAAGFELIAGERRLRAAKQAGLATIPAVVRESDDAESLREALIENIHREDLNPIELAEAFRELLEELGLKQETLAERLGVSRSHIANTIRLLQLPLEVQQLLADGRMQAGHGRALLSLGDAEAQRTLAVRIAAEDLTVREVEELVRQLPRASRRGQRPRAGLQPAPEPKENPLAEVEEILSEQLATRVQIQMGTQAGEGRDRVRLRGRPGPDRLRDRRVRPRARARVAATRRYELPATLEVASRRGQGCGGARVQRRTRSHSSSKRDARRLRGHRQQAGVGHPRRHVHVETQGCPSRVDHHVGARRRRAVRAPRTPRAAAAWDAAATSGDRRAGAKYSVAPGVYRAA